jgi:hypothetical protein
MKRHLETFERTDAMYDNVRLTRRDEGAVSAILEVRRGKKLPSAEEMARQQAEYAAYLKSLEDEAEQDASSRSGHSADEYAGDDNESSHAEQSESQHSSDDDDDDDDDNDESSSSSLFHYRCQKVPRYITLPDGRWIVNTGQKQPRYSGSIAASSSSPASLSPLSPPPPPSKRRTRSTASTTAAESVLPVPEKMSRDNAVSLRSLLARLTDWTPLVPRLVDAATKHYRHPLCGESLILVRTSDARALAFSHATHGYYGEVGHPLTFRTWPARVVHYDAIVTANTRRVSEFAYYIDALPLPACEAHQRSTQVHGTTCLWQLYNVYCAPANEQCACRAPKQHHVCYNVAEHFVAKLAANEEFYTFVRNRRMHSRHSEMARNFAQLTLPTTPVLELIDVAHTHDMTVRQLLLEALEDRSKRVVVVETYCRKQEVVK